MEGETLDQWMTAQNISPSLQSTLTALFAACKEIGYKVRTASCNKISCFNQFGDEQLAVDVLANKILFDQFEACDNIATASSEEEPIEKDVGGRADDVYSVAFDPLDGSSIVDTNFAVGTIFGVWPGTKLTGIKGSEMVAGGLCTYGPRTSMSIAIDGVEGAHEFLLVDDYTGLHGSWVHAATFTAIDSGKLFAPGNLRATQDNPGYNELFNYWLGNKYQLRYTGGMVPDVNQLLIKGKGVYVTPSSPSCPSKLRLLYEVAPLGYLIEKGGGMSSDGEKSVLEIPITTTDVRTQCAYGSEEEVERFNTLVGTKYAAALTPAA